MFTKKECRAKTYSKFIKDTNVSTADLSFTSHLYIFPICCFYLNRWQSTSSLMYLTFHCILRTITNLVITASCLFPHSWTQENAFHRPACWFPPSSSWLGLDVEVCASGHLSGCGVNTCSYVRCWFDTAFQIVELNKLLWSLIGLSAQNWSLRPTV